MTHYAKPLPEITDENREFWAGTLAGELRLQSCDKCGLIRYPISIACPECLSRGFKWTAVSGSGEVFSYIVFHQVYNKAFADDVPYNVALIQLDEGPRMFGNVVDCENHDVAVGDRVQVVMDKVTDEVAIPRFRKVEES